MLKESENQLFLPTPWESQPAPAKGEKWPSFQATIPDKNFQFQKDLFRNNSTLDQNPHSVMLNVITGCFKTKFQNKFSNLTV